MKILKQLLNWFGYSLVKNLYYPYSTRETFKLVKPFTMTCIERIHNLLELTDYLYINNIKGDILETGVWKGGSMMAMAIRLLELGDTKRLIHLFDTFEGTPILGEEDSLVSRDKINHKKYYKKSICSVAECNEAMWKSRYPHDNFIFHVGLVEEKLPYSKLDKLALVRLDTNTYQSTLSSLYYLWPLIVPGGVLIIDDYGHWEGCKAAVDKFFGEDLGYKPFMFPVGYTCRVIIKGAPNVQSYDKGMAMSMVPQEVS